MIFARYWVALTVVCGLTAGCGTGSVTPSPPAVALGAPQQATVEPVNNSTLKAGVPYRFGDVVPGLEDVELTAPAPGAFVNFNSTYVSLATDSSGDTSVVAFTAVAGLLVFTKPFISPDNLTSDDDVRNATEPAPSQLLDYFTKVPFLQVTQPERDVRVGNLTGRAIDARVLPLPAAAYPCDAGKPKLCAGVYEEPIGAYFAQSAGDVIRLIVVSTPGGGILVNQNLALPQAQTILDGARFIPRSQTTSASPPPTS